MLESRELVVRYRAEEILRGVTVCQKEGELLSLIGPNGCGKSTLLKALVGLVPHESGEVLLDGVCAAQYKRSDRAKKLAYLAQGKRLPEMTVAETVLHGRFPYLGYPARYSANDHAIAARAMVEMGLEALASRAVASLSGGQMQKVYLAMALAQETPYLLLDEPTTYLDVGHQLELMRILRRLANEGRGVLAVLHDLPLALTFSDRVAVMQEGRLVACDTPAALVEQDVFSRVFGVSIVRCDNIYRCVY